MLSRFGLAMTVAAGLCFAGSQAMAQDATDYTRDEQKCEGFMGKTLAKEVKGISKCVNRCLKAQRKESVPDYASCLMLAPSDPCITDALRGPRAKAAVTIGKKCDPALGKDCPDCFSTSSVANGPISCSNGSPMPERIQTLALGTGLTFYCLEASNMTPTTDEAKCEDTAVKEAVKYVASINKCTDKCTKRIIAGKIADDACAPANGATGIAPSDPAALACIVKATDKFSQKLDQTCAGIKPSCYPADLNDLVGIVFGTVQHEGQFVFCGG
jgi:hypothetical protein